MSEHVQNEHAASTKKLLIYVLFPSQNQHISFMSLKQPFSTRVPWQNVYKLPTTCIQASGWNKPAFLVTQRHRFSLCTITTF
ncbi:unnamed protein product [Staurois parvus]|uniref:Uncharacterized protein n=1 Tax=Staurois parvus TaxID=386267 RepID=A0ABN9CRQ3_9NEOB|nr:unnamed protein product [Staurois parvus]